MVDKHDYKTQLSCMYEGRQCEQSCRQTRKVTGFQTTDCEYGLGEKGTVSPQKQIHFLGFYDWYIRSE